MFIKKGDEVRHLRTGKKGTVSCDSKENEMVTFDLNENGTSVYAPRSSIRVTKTIDGRPILESSQLTNEEPEMPEAVPFKMFVPIDQFIGPYRWDE